MCIIREAVDRMIVAICDAVERFGGKSWSAGHA